MSSNIISNQPENRANESAPRRGSQTRALHEAICASCGTPTMLPFKPTAERPGYCLSCYSDRNNGNAKDRSSSILPSRKPGRQANSVREESRNYPKVSGVGVTSKSSEQAPLADGVGSTAISEIFAGLNIQARTRSALSRMGIASPTPIQEQAIPWLNQGRDIVGQAMTGSGKTLAFGIPLVEGCDSSIRGVQGLVLVPTRELAIQVASVLDEVSEGRVAVMLLYGGRPVGSEKRALQKGAQIIVGTPGRTLDHLRQGNLALGSVRMLVLDEADEMLDRGFARDVESIISATPTKRQTALFSATLPDWVEKTAHKHLRDAKTIQVASAEGEGLKIEHLIYRIDKAEKMPALQTLLNQRGGAPIIVFGKTKHGVKKLAKQLVDLGYPVGPLQGNMSQNAREKVMADFRSGVTPVLVATNVAARGLDVEGIAQVINFDLPDSLQLFTHRVGRTGRMGKDGEAITFVAPEDEKKWRELERGFDFTFTIKRWTQSGPGTTKESSPRPEAAQRQSTQRQTRQPRPEGTRQDPRRRGTFAAPRPPLHETEQNDSPRSTHTRPPSAGPAKRSPWLRFGRRD